MEYKRWIYVERDEPIQNIVNTNHSLDYCNADICSLDNCSYIIAHLLGIPWIQHNHANDLYGRFMGYK